MLDSVCSIAYEDLTETDPSPSPARLIGSALRRLGKSGAIVESLELLVAPPPDSPTFDLATIHAWLEVRPRMSRCFFDLRNDVNVLGPEGKWLPDLSASAANALREACPMIQASLAGTGTIEHGNISTFETRAAPLCI